MKHTSIIAISLLLAGAAMASTKVSVPVKPDQAAPAPAYFNVAAAAYKEGESKSLPAVWYGGRVTNQTSNTAEFELTISFYVSQGTELFGNTFEGTVKGRGVTIIPEVPPLKKIAGSSFPNSYSTPIRNKTTSPRPTAHAPATKPQPFLDEEVFQEVLKTLRDMELVMERSPSAFRDLDEEAIRTHFLVALNGKFEGEATGETFNFHGKTDILLRQGGRNIFIAECKFWTAPKGFTETINHLLGYFTWRDTKAAIIGFVRETAISTVLSKIPGLLRDHPNFISEQESPHPSEFLTPSKIISRTEVGVPRGERA